MFKVAMAFMKPYLGWIAGGAVALVVGAFSWLAVDLAMTKSALNNANSELKQAEMIIESQERAIEAINIVEEYRTDMRRFTRMLNTRIMEAEGANQEVPPAVANAWADGIDSLRAQTDDTGRVEDVRTP
jgi:hypothetical protein